MVAPLIATVPQEVRPQLEAFILGVFKVSVCVCGGGASRKARSVQGECVGGGAEGKLDL